MNPLKRILFILLLTESFCNEIFTQAPRVYTVIFTHIEDNTPSGMLGSFQSRQNYLIVRNRLLEMGLLMKSYDIPWSFQPDWKILLAALIYEDSSLVQTTGGKNFLRFIKEDLDAAIDPHSHENGGYNYTDVAHLLDSLGVGGSKVIGGHIWDPSLPQFAAWDRFRNPVMGLKFPWAVWQGNILMGSGTPNHINDPLVSGVWRPKDRDHYFTDDPNGNIFCVGKYKEEYSSISELIELYRNSSIEPGCMLTASYHVNLASMSAPGGFITIENTLLKPLDSLRKLNLVALTDFTSLINEWNSTYHANACLYDPQFPTSTIDHQGDDWTNSLSIYPNPFTNRIFLKSTEADLRFELRNMNAQLIWCGNTLDQKDFSDLYRGVYFLKILGTNNNVVRQLIKI